MIPETVKAQVRQKAAAGQLEVADPSGPAHLGRNIQVSGRARPLSPAAQALRDGQPLKPGPEAKPGKPSRGAQTRGTVSSYQPPTWVQQDLTAEELGLQHFLSRITFETSGGADPWQEWSIAPSQTGLDALRYPLAFGAYASFILGSRTPAYTELAGLQMRDAIERMLENIVWSYIESYWADEPSFPDPVYVENVMYSGHLLQMMTMYQLLTGDDRYATDGFDFVWKDGTMIHYTLHQLAARLYTMTQEHRSGGICCEPSMIFVYCNNHSSIGLQLYDWLYAGYYSGGLERWRRWMQCRAPFARESNAFFKIAYYTDVNAFIPVGDPGGDAWGLGWMVPWNSDSAFIARGWEDLLTNPLMVEEADGTVHLQVSALLQSSVTEAMSTGFLPLLARQLEGPDSPMAAGVFQWLEPAATWSDEDGDGLEETFRYETGEDRNVVTALVAAGMATWAPDQLVTSLRNPLMAFGTGPQVMGVDYPNVDVLRAYRLADGGLEVRLAKGRTIAPAQTRFQVSPVPATATVTRDGQPYLAVEPTETGLAITTDLAAPHTFRVSF